MNQLSGDVKKNLETRESDKATLQKLDQPSVSNSTLANTREDGINSTSKVAAEIRAENGLKKKASGLTGLKIDLKSTKRIVSRSHLFEEATERVIQTGEVTRVTTDSPKERQVVRVDFLSSILCVNWKLIFIYLVHRKPCSFADIFRDKTASELPSPRFKSGGKFTMSKENDVIELSDVASSNSKLFNSFKGLMTNESLPAKTQNQADANRSQRMPSLSDEKFRMKSNLHSGRSVGNSIHEKKKVRAKVRHRIMKSSITFLIF